MHNNYANRGKIYQPAISDDRWRVKERLLLFMGTAVQDGKDHLTMEETEPRGEGTEAQISEMNTHSTKCETNF